MNYFYELSMFPLIDLYFSPAKEENHFINCLFFFFFSLKLFTTLSFMLGFPPAVTFIIIVCEVLETDLVMANFSVQWFV
ncbi:hypothetical protein Sjap_026540 [Stephania japonica]|uniref:Uncharacterized protein n=1 Tax=Stephania japonica TaxID=461633 RepID=A0AAP0HGJ1_9MAGN